MTLTRHRLVSFIALLMPLSLFASSLIPCPDCGHLVSPRALMCPGCGCHGEAIAEEAARLEALLNPPIYPVVHVETAEAKGYALAVRDGEKNFVLLDMHLLGDASRLRMTTLSNEMPVTYHSMQIADSAPLIRFETSATNLLFMGRAVAGATPGKPVWLLSDGSTVEALPTDDPPYEALALVDDHTNVLQVIVRYGNDVSVMDLPDKSDWLDVAPGVYRQQIAQLNDVAGGVVPEAIPEPWITSYIENLAREYFEREIMEKTR